MGLHGEETVVGQFGEIGDEKKVDLELFRSRSSMIIFRREMKAHFVDLYLAIADRRGLSGRHRLQFGELGDILSCLKSTLTIQQQT